MDRMKDVLTLRGRVQLEMPEELAKRAYSLKDYIDILMPALHPGDIDVLIFDDMRGDLALFTSLSPKLSMIIHGYMQMCINYPSNYSMMLVYKATGLVLHFVADVNVLACMYTPTKLYEKHLTKLEATDPLRHAKRVMKLIDDHKSEYFNDFVDADNRHVNLSSMELKFYEIDGTHAMYTERLLSELGTFRECNYRVVNPRYLDQLTDRVFFGKHLIGMGKELSLA